jgi:hypothetical protein
VSALVKHFLAELAGGESDPERLKREERPLRKRLSSFRAADCPPREDVHDQNGVLEPVVARYQGKVSRIAGWVVTSDVGLMNVVSAAATVHRPIAGMRWAILAVIGGQTVPQIHGR